MSPFKVNIIRNQIQLDLLLLLQLKVSNLFFALTLKITLQIATVFKFYNCVLIQTTMASISGNFTLIHFPAALFLELYVCRGIRSRWDELA